MRCFLVRREPRYRTSVATLLELMRLRQPQKMKHAVKANNAGVGCNCQDIFCLRVHLYYCITFFFQFLVLVKGPS